MLNTALYFAFAVHLVDTIVKSLSENGVRVITLNVETKTDKDVAQFIINSFHYVGNMTIVCSNKCIGRILTMVSIVGKIRKCYKAIFGKRCKSTQT